MFRLCCLLTLLYTPWKPLCAQEAPQPFTKATPGADKDCPKSDEGVGRAGIDDGPTTWRTLAPDVLEQQRNIYRSFPSELAHGKHWLSVAVFLGATGALVAVDQYESPYFRRSTNYQGFNAALSGTNTSLLILGVPAATYFTGLIEKNSYAQSTALLAGEAVLDSEITAELLRVVTRRARPESIPLAGNFADSWVDSRTITDGGFPSGHTIAAFSVATIMSQRYGHEHRWVPYLAYAAAGTIGFSRVTLSSHNISDVFAGAALGYVISRFVVLRHHQ